MGISVASAQFCPEPKTAIKYFLTVLKQVKKNTKRFSHRSTSSVFVNLVFTATL